MGKSCRRFTIYAGSNQNPVFAQVFEEHRDNYEKLAERVSYSSVVNKIEKEQNYAKKS